MNIANADKNKLARSGEDYLALLASDADWIARSEDDLRSLRRSGSAALGKLPEADFEEFLSGLTYHNGGVADGSYRPLMKTLTITEIFQVFEAWGMSPSYTQETLEQKCASGSWEFEFWSFCSSACAHHVVKQ